MKRRPRPIVFSPAFALFIEEPQNFAGAGDRTPAVDEALQRPLVRAEAKRLEKGIPGDVLPLPHVERRFFRRDERPRFVQGADGEPRAPGNRRTGRRGQGPRAGGEDVGEVLVNDRPFSDFQAENAVSVTISTAQPFAPLRRE